MIDAIKSTSDLDGMPHGTSIRKTVEDKAVNLADKAAEWKIAELDALHVKQKVFDLVHSIPGVEGRVLTERYINLRKWEDICTIIGYEWAQTHRFHSTALTLVEEKMIHNDTL